MLTASDARERTNKITKRDLAYTKAARLRDDVARVLDKAARIQLAAIQLKQYEAHVDVPNVRTMMKVEKELANLGYDTCCAPESLWVKFSWRRRRQVKSHHS